MNNFINIDIKPVDTLMFRDGKPFNQNDAGASVASSVFPPYPPTVVGAIRLAMAKHYGFDGRSQETWPGEIVGDGVNWQQGATTGELAFSAIHILENEKLLFPIPLHVVEGTHDETKEISLLKPGKPLSCDLGDLVRLPVPVNGNLKGIKPLKDYWITAKGMAQILKLENFSNTELREKKTDLWQEETRVGIGINSQNRRVNDGQLYMASHVRVSDKVSLHISVQTENVRELPAQLIPLAGEHRMASLEVRSDASQSALPACPFDKSQQHSEKILYTVIHLNPCLLDRIPKPGEKLAGLPGTVVSACTGKMQMIGGWDSLRRNPIPMRPAIPAGSVWFMVCDASEGHPADYHGKHIGHAGNWGFGQILVGRWAE